MSEFLHDDDRGALSDDLSCSRRTPAPLPPDDVGIFQELKIVYYTRDNSCCLCSSLKLQSSVVTILYLYFSTSFVEVN